MTRLHPGIRKIQSDANVGERGFSFTSPGLDKFGDHRDYGSWAHSSSSNRSTVSVHRRPSTAKSSVGSQDGFNCLISVDSRSSASTGVETLLTPSHSSHDLVPAPLGLGVDEAVNILFTRSEAKPLSAGDLDTLARIRAAYPDPNERSFATASVIQKSKSNPRPAFTHPNRSDSVSYRPCPATDPPHVSSGIGKHEGAERDIPSPSPTEYADCEDWTPASSEAVYRLPKLTPSTNIPAWDET